MEENVARYAALFPVQVSSRRSLPRADSSGALSLCIICVSLCTPTNYSTKLHIGSNSSAFFPLVNSFWQVFDLEYVAFSNSQTAKQPRSRQPEECRQALTSKV